MLATMLGVADQALILGVDDPIEHLKWNLTDQDGKTIADLADVDGALTTLDGQSDRAIDRHRHGPADASGLAGPGVPQAKLSDQAFGHEQAIGARVHQGVVDLDEADLIRGDQAAFAILNVKKVLDPGGDNRLAHQLGLHATLPIALVGLKVLIQLVYLV
jgi:hypothetical protein